METFISVNGGEQRVGLPSIDEHGLGVDPEPLVEVCNGHPSYSATSTTELNLVRDKFKGAALGKIADRDRERGDGNGDFSEEDSHRQACGMLYDGESEQGEDDTKCRSQVTRYHSHQNVSRGEGIVHHSFTLFRERLVSKAEVMEAWKLRIIEDLSSSVLLDPTNYPFKMMNTLIWNCRGAMKPQFRKTVLDLVEWHAPMLMVITETRLSGARAVEMIESLPFDGSVVADTIGFADGIWLL